MQGPFHYDADNDTAVKQAARSRAFGSQRLASVAEKGQEVLDAALKELVPYIHNLSSVKMCDKGTSFYVSTLDMPDAFHTWSHLLL